MPSHSTRARIRSSSRSTARPHAVFAVDHAQRVALHDDRRQHRGIAAGQHPDVFGDRAVHPRRTAEHEV
ncbi:hypothetical protein DMP23_46730, partial [Amycolatopsis sp. A1MSW2902]|uniref:hypothetical protein n=1 Tax=Amycolatopsis sp. A1MSW2902 TaxID=687413 RepID=UPI00307CEF97